MLHVWVRDLCQVRRFLVSNRLIEYSSPSDTLVPHIYGVPPKNPNQTYNIYRVVTRIYQDILHNQGRHGLIKVECGIYASTNQATIGSENGLLPIRCHDMIWINAGLLLTWPLGKNSVTFEPKHNNVHTIIQMGTFASKRWPFFSRMQCVKIRPIGISLREFKQALHIVFVSLK